MSKSVYQKKRDFSKTTEPKGDKKGKRGKRPIFVIQKHDATNLHYDFRLEINNTLKSWAVPKGPSTNPDEKRMAIPTEDHPLDYANFEGKIPEDQYGGGTVIIWDKGTFENIRSNEKDEVINLNKSFKEGVLEIKLKGKKINGGYSFIKMKSGKMKGNWLLIKKDDSEADARRKPVNTENKSVISAKTIKDIEND